MTLRWGWVAWQSSRAREAGFRRRRRTRSASPTVFRGWLNLYRVQGGSDRDDGVRAEAAESMRCTIASFLACLEMSVCGHQNTTVPISTTGNTETCKYRIDPADNPVQGGMAPWKGPAWMRSGRGGGKNVPRVHAAHGRSESRFRTAAWSESLPRTAVFSSPGG